MKTSIKTLVSSALTAIVLSSALLVTSASANETKPAVVSAPTGFKKIILKGNVEVILVQSQKESISYSDDNNTIAKITQEGDVLKISSSDRETSKLIVYVNDIYRIEASENASVRTRGKLSSRYLQIFLKGNAHADITSNTEGLYTVIKDNSDLKLSGSTDNHTLIMGKTPKLTIDRFAALKTNITTEDAGESYDSFTAKETVAVIK
jgi:hypothetical protein